MPAAAVIPAPIAYIKAAAVKKLVVGSRGGRRRSVVARPRGRGVDLRRRAAPSSAGSLPRPLFVERLGRPAFYFEKIRVFKAGQLCPDNRAWNDGTGPPSRSAGLRGGGND